MRYLNNKLIPPEWRLKSGHDPFLVPIGVRVYVPGVRPYYGCTEGYNGPITGWTDNHNVDIIVARLNQDNADNAIASGEDQRLLGKTGNWHKFKVKRWATQNLRKEDIWSEEEEKGDQ